MIIVTGAYLGVLIIFYILSAKKYSDIVNSLDKKSYPFKAVLPIGLYILEAFKYSFNTSYDRRLYSAMAELHGHKQALMFLKIHWGNKIILMLVSLLFAFFVGAGSDFNIGYGVFCVLLPAAIAYSCDRDVFEKVKKRRAALQLEFPDFVNKITLLINAGMTVSRAWEKAALDNGKQTPLYIELRRMQQEIKAGVSEHRAYEEFAKRCRVPVITRFISVILQNIRKGNSELVPIMRVFANECWEIRKNTAKKYGEEASTKLLLPMIMMFVAILIIVGMPAVLALKNI